MQPPAPRHEVAASPPGPVALPPISAAMVDHDAMVDPGTTSRRRRFKPVRRVVRRLRRWYRTSQTGDVVTTLVCLCVVVLLLAAGVTYLVVA